MSLIEGRPREKAASATKAVFNRAYYDRFYERRATRVQGPEDVARICRGVLAMTEWVGEDVKSVLEVGAGTGLWRDWFAEAHPKVRYRSTDVSAYACERYGHEPLDIGASKLRGRFDLVVCQGVLPYLDDEAALRAIDHLGAMTGKFLWLECQTDRDIDRVVDHSVSDAALIGRPARFYADRLRLHYDMLGLGLWVSRRVKLPLYELESGTLAG